MLGTAPLVILAIVPLGSWLLVPLENRFPRPEVLPEEVDGVIVLGGMAGARVSTVRDQLTLGNEAERWTALVELAQRYPGARLVFAGASGDPFGESAPEAELVEPKPGERWLLVTSAYRMPRSVGAFRQAGWSVIAYPVNYRTTGRYEFNAESFDGAGEQLKNLDQAVHEWIRLLAYRVRGRTDAFFPAPWARDTRSGLAASPQSRRRRSGRSSPGAPSRARMGDAAVCQPGVVLGVAHEAQPGREEALARVACRVLDLALLPPSRRRRPCVRPGGASTSAGSTG
jgi:uncharacterized SAM-binding protein YcdF (DUF218 family)